MTDDRIVDARYERAMAGGAWWQGNMPEDDADPYCPECRVIHAPSGAWTECDPEPVPEPDRCPVQESGCEPMA